MIAASVMAPSCIMLTMYLDPDQPHSFEFHNESRNNIYVVVDEEPQDNVITVDSYWKQIAAHGSALIWDDDPWRKVVSDSVYLYVIDANKVDFGIEYRPLTQSNIDKVSSEMILERITLYHRKCHGNFSVTYPSER